MTLVKSTASDKTASDSTASDQSHRHPVFAYTGQTTPNTREITTGREEGIGNQSSKISNGSTIKLAGSGMDLPARGSL